MKVKIDLDTRAGRAAMRAWLDEIDRQDDQLPAFLRSVVTPKPEGGAPMRAPDPNSPIGGIPDPDPVELPPAEPAAPPIPEDFTDPDGVPFAPEPEAAPVSGETPEPAPAEPDGFPAPQEEDALAPAPPGLDANRSWTDEDKRLVWSLAESGLYSQSQIARHLGRNLKQVSNWIGHVRRGTQKVPELPGTALVPVEAGGALARVERPPYAIDPVIQADRDADLAEAQVEAFVRRELYQQQAPAAS